MVLQFVSLTPDPPEIRGGGLALHPLDVCHRSLLHGTPSQVCKGRRDEFVPSATELDQAGIQFARSLTRSLHDILFLHGVLYIPELTVDETTEHKLLSLMAFERLHADAGANEEMAYVSWAARGVAARLGLGGAGGGGGVGRSRSPLGGARWVAPVDRSWAGAASVMDRMGKMAVSRYRRLQG